MTLVDMERIRHMSNQYFLQSLHETVNTMTGFELEEVKGEEDFSCEITGAMVLAGSQHILLAVSASREDAKTLVAYMTGMDVEGHEESVLCDGLEEMVNVTAGLVKARLSNTEYSIRLTSPFAICADKLHFNMKKHAEIYEAYLYGHEIKLKLSVGYL